MWIACVLIGLVAAYRLFTGMHEGYWNFAPVMALAFCSGIYLRGVWRWAIPLGALVVSDMILNRYFGLGWVEPFMIATTACYAAAIALGIWVSERKSFGLILGGVLGSGFLFYVVSNTLAWWVNPAYASDWAGWWQALTVGVPGYPPTYMFFRNSLVSDLIFTGAFVLCMEWGLRRVGQPSLLPTRGESVRA